MSGFGVDASAEASLTSAARAVSLLAPRIVGFLQRGPRVAPRLAQAETPLQEICAGSYERSLLSLGMTMNKFHFPSHTALALVVASLVVVNSGCRSASGSRWASLNPWSKPSSETALASSGEKLPSDGATPLIEGAEKTTPAASAVASLTPPTTGAPTPASEAAAAPAIPKIEKPGSALASKQPPTGAPSDSTAPPYVSKPAPSTAVASAGPYDPNGYQPAASTPAAPTEGGSDRYGLDNRYASTPSVPSGFEDMPPLNTPTPPAATGDRYASAAPAAVGDRYGIVAAPPAEQTISEPKVEDLAPPAPATSEPAVSGLAAVSPYPSAVNPPAEAKLPTPPPAASPAYPVAAAEPSVAPATNPTAPSSLGTLPTQKPRASVYAAGGVTPATPTDEAPSSGSVVRLTSLPGEYRPGGTGTYRSRVSVASNPAEKAAPATPPASYPTATQLR